MKRTILFFLITAFVLGTATAYADSGATVDAIQMPAWYDRDGKTYPLKPGVKLYSGDVVRTGKNSRALLRMNEGSAVKLGEDAILNLSSLAPAKKKWVYLQH